MKKNYTSINAFAAGSVDEQVNIGIDNMSGKPIMRVTTVQNIQATDTKDIKITSTKLFLTGNTVAQLKALYEYAKECWEQSSKKQFDDNNEQTDFVVYDNPETITQKHIDHESGHFVVEIIEHDRFSGPKLDSTKYFKTEEEARKFIKEYNSKNTSKVVPEWYMTASAKNF